MKYKVLITTSGTGSRLGELTKRTNKALIPIAGKPALFYILDQLPKELPIVLTVGYLADQVRSVVQQQYPDREISFVPVDRFEGPGSSLGYSLLQAEAELQMPFVFWACDTLITQPLPQPDHNWVAGFQPPEGFDASSYRTHLIQNDRLIRVNDKGDTPFQSIHIGITGIDDYRAFWRFLKEEYTNDPTNSGLSDVHIISKMLAHDIIFNVVPLSVWCDTGNPNALKQTEAYFNRTQ